MMIRAGDGVDAVSAIADNVVSIGNVVRISPSMARRCGRRAPRTVNVSLRFAAPLAIEQTVSATRSAKANPSRPLSRASNAPKTTVLTSPIEANRASWSIIETGAGRRGTIRPSAWAP